MTALDTIRKQGARDAAPRSVVVPEWDGLEIFYRPITIADLSEAVRASKGDQIRQNVEMFCIIATKADGTAMFKRIDALDLMSSADPEVLGRVCREMGIIRESSPEVVEKN